jgi:hypothetical protein
MRGYTDIDTPKFHPLAHTHFIFQHVLTLAPRYSTARVDNLCEDWSGDYFPHEGQDPHRIYVQPFCTTEYHPKPHAHGIYAGPYSLRRRCMGGLAAHRLVGYSSMVLYVCALHRCCLQAGFFLGSTLLGDGKRAQKGNALQLESQTY